MQPPFGASLTNVSGEDRNQEDGKLSSIKFQNVIFLEKKTEMLMVSLNMLIQLTPQTKCVTTSTAVGFRISYMNSQHVKVQVLTIQVLVIFSNVMVQILSAVLAQSRQYLHPSKSF